MNIEEYIASGVLELYVTGLLSPAEMVEVERMAVQYPQVRAELDAVSDTLNAYAQLHAVEPPAALKSKILREIEVSSYTVSHDITTPSATATEFIQRPMYPETTPGISTTAKKINWLAVAASVLLLISVGLNFYFFNNWQHSESQYQIALATQDKYAQQVQQVNQKLQGTADELALITHNKTRKVNLKGLPKSPSSLVVVYWNTKTKDVLVKVDELPVPPPNQQYQLWALENGKPINAGLLTVESDSITIQRMKTILNAQAFAITLEPKGGSVDPTLEEMYAMGQI